MKNDKNKAGIVRGPLRVKKGGNWEGPRKDLERSKQCAGKNEENSEREKRVGKYGTRGASARTKEMRKNWSCEQKVEKKALRIGTPFGKSGRPNKQGKATQKATCAWGMHRGGRRLFEDCAAKRRGRNWVR